ncbi:MAG: HAEPLYID family protein [Cytophagaceae bacterium]
MKYPGIFFLLFLPSLVFSQNLPVEEEDERRTVDREIIDDEEEGSPPKVFHAEPVFIDLIADLGARKGERALELGLGMEDHLSYYRYSALIEYEFVPINRLGIELELPVTLYSETAESGNKGQNNNDREGSRLNAFRTAVQYTFLVSERTKTSMALGYLNELKLPDFRDYGAERIFQGNFYNPFLVVAKRFGYNFHTLILAGPVFDHDFSHGTLDAFWQINTNFHYMIPGTRSFMGVEFNKEIEDNSFAMTIRPQVILNLSDSFSLGFAAGIPVNRDTQRMSTFARLIYDIK